MKQKHIKIIVAFAFISILLCLLPSTQASAAFYTDNLTRSHAYNAMSYFRNTIMHEQPNWTGSVSGCNAGSVSSSFTQATLDTVNYFRNMAKLPAVTFNATDSAKAQQAALMMLANNQLNHYPPSSWQCYTSDGAAAAASSNLALGYSGPGAVMLLYMDDSSPSSNLSSLGHRRWILSGAVQVMGSGDTNTTNALYIEKGGSTVAGAPKYAGWPASDYFAVQLAPSRWSLSNSDGSVDMSHAQVSVTIHGTTTAKSVIAMPSGYGDDAIAWDMPDLSTSPFPDLPVKITVTNLKTSGGVALPDYTYTTILYDMFSATSPAASGSSTGGTPQGSGSGSKTSSGGSSSKATNPGSSTTSTSPSNLSPDASLPPPHLQSLTVDGRIVAIKPQLSFSTNQSINLRGQTIPNGIIGLTIHSAVRTASVTADKDGNWSYKLTSLEPGQHHIDATVTDPTTKHISPTTQLIAFTLTAASNHSASKTAASSTPTHRKSFPILAIVIVSGVIGIALFSGYKLWGRHQSPKPPLHKT